MPPGATAVCTGSQTNVGTSLNTYRINWAGNNPANYTIVENLGALRVDPVPIQVWSGSANDVVKDSPLTNPNCGINGWNGEGITVRATGSQLDEGTSVNTVEINWNGANPANYAVTYNLGTLTVGH